jgi:uncharacterized protein YycO
MGGKPPGVQIRPAGYRKWPVVIVYTIVAGPGQEADFWDFLMAQIGKPYDWRAIIAFAINRDWRDDSAWYCSELQARALEVAGVIKPGYLGVNKVTPVMLAEVVSQIGEVT